MRQFDWEVVEVTAWHGHTRWVCRGPAPEFVPGQGALALPLHASPTDWRTPLYPFSTQPGHIEFCLPADHPYASLLPGDTLNVIGPCGRGFQWTMPNLHLLLITSDLTRLAALFYHALAARWSVTWLLPPTTALPDLPPEVEILRGDFTSELGAWADLIALDVPHPLELAHTIHTLCPTRPRELVQAFITSAMPCGVGACQACWVEVGAPARKLACVEGPVFNV